MVQCVFISVFYLKIHQNNFFSDFIFKFFISAYQNHWKTLKKNINLMFFFMSIALLKHIQTHTNAMLNSMCMYMHWAFVLFLLLMLKDCMAQPGFYGGGILDLYDKIVKAVYMIKIAIYFNLSYWTCLLNARKHHPSLYCYPAIQPLQLEFLKKSPLNIIQVSTVIQPQQKSNQVTQQHVGGMTCVESNIISNGFQW